MPSFQFSSIGFPELLIILMIALLLFGRRGCRNWQFPRRAISEFKRGLSGRRLGSAL
jgi:Sec-independent protein translocase protein TatA